MLSIHENVTEYCKILEVPFGYKRECLLATTFSIDKTVLRHLLVLSAFPRLPSVDTENLDELKVMNAVDALKGKFYVICHRGQIYSSGRRNRIDVLFDHFIIEMKSTEYYSCFHPKIILQAFQPGLDTSGEPIIRVTVSSRNLTMPQQTHLELQFTTEGFVEKNKNKFGEDLADYCSKMLYQTRVKNDKLLGSLLERCSRTKFNFSDDVDGAAVEWLLKGPQDNIISNGPDPKIGNDKIIKGNSLIISPFISANILEIFKPRYLITSQYALKNIDLVKVLREFKENKILEDCLVLGMPENDGEEVTNGLDQDVLSELTDEMGSIDALHAKMIAYNDKDHIKMVMGSSNFTSKGLMSGNWEANLSFKLKKVKNIKDIFLDITQFKNEKKLYQPWPFFSTPNFDVDPVVDPETQALESLHKKYKEFLFQVRHKVNYTISICGERLSLNLDKDISHPDLRFQFLSDDGREFVKESEQYFLEKGTINAWSGFIKIKVFSSQYKDGKEPIYYFTIRAECSQKDVQFRDRKLKKDIINSRDTFIGYALNALSDIEASAMMRARVRNWPLDNSGSTRAYHTICRILGVENIIKTLASDPSSIVIFDRIAEINRQLEEHVQDKEFMRFWDRCKKALLKSCLKVDAHA